MISSRRLLPLFGGLCILYTVGWYQAAAWLEREVTALQAEAQSRFIGIDSSWENAVGFPGAIRLHSTRWRVETAAGLRWSGDGVTITLHPWRPWEIEARLDGLHRIDAELNAARRISIALDATQATMPFTRDFARVVVKSLTYTENNTQQATITDFATEAALTPGLPDPPNREGLRRWIGEGGRMTFVDTRGRFESARFEAQGWLALDAEFRPAGRADLELTNYAPALRALAERGLIDARNLGLVEIGLAWLSVPDAQTGAPVLKLPLVAENGTLSLGPVGLASLAPLF